MPSRAVYRRADNSKYGALCRDSVLKREQAVQIHDLWPIHRVTDAVRRRWRVVNYGLHQRFGLEKMVARADQFSTHRALVVEDSEHILYMLEFILRRAGYDVNAVANGRDAQSAIENLDPVDVIVLDLMLPYVSGYQLITEIRDNSLWQHVPIVVVSGRVMEHDIVKALDLGANDYVTKPFRPEELLARLRRVVADHERMAART